MGGTHHRRPCSAGLRAVVAVASLCGRSAEAQQACEERCPFGQVSAPSSEAAGGCGPCPEGHSIHLLTGDSCVRCEAGRFSNANMTICEDCPPGFSSEAGSSACSACPAGQSAYQGDPTCERCADGTHTAEPGTPACVHCPTGLMPNHNHTACVCKPGYFDSNLYPKMKRNSEVAWRDQPSVEDCAASGGPCCIECSKVICPADVCSLVDLADPDADTDCVAEPTRCKLECATDQECVQCPGGAMAYMWPRRDFWVPDPATLAIDPLDGDPETKKTAGLSYLLSFSVVAVEQCHPAGPDGVCAGLPESNASLTARERNDYDSCREDPQQCCRHNKVQKDKLCGACAQDYLPHPTRSVCERCDGHAWGGVLLFFLKTSLMALLMDFKARQLDVEEDGGGLAILLFFAMQLSLYAQKSQNVVVAYGQSLVQSFLLLEPPGDDDGSGTCTFNMKPYTYFYFKVFVVTIYQYLLVVGIGKMVDGMVNPSDMMQVTDDRTVNPLTDTGIGEKSSPVEKAKSYLLDHYDSSNLRYLRSLPEETQPAQISRRYATYLWWQGATTALKRKQAGKQQMRGQLQVLVSLYIPITKLCISMLFCRPVPEGDEIDWRSTYDVEVGCFDARHIVASIAALGVLGCFTLGFPAFIYIRMSTLRDTNGAWKPGRFTTLVRLSYVFKEDRRAWQAVVMVRQVWLVGAKIMADLFASPENQTLPFAAFNGELDWRWGPFVVILLSVHLQALYRPYALAHDNVLEQACLLVLLFVIWADVTLATSTSMNVLVLVIAIASITSLYVSQVRGRKVARSIHRADLFSDAGGNGSSIGDTTPAVDVTSEDFEVTQTKSIGAAVQNKLAIAENNPLADAGNSARQPNVVVSALYRKALQLDPADIKLLKGELRLTDDEIKSQLQLFATFDADGSGYLTVSELSKMFELAQGVRVSDGTIRKLIGEIDSDHDGNISFSEFVQVMVRHARQRDANEELVEAFKIFLESVEETDESSPASRITREMVCAVFTKAGIFEADARPDDPRIDEMWTVAATDAAGNSMPGMGDALPQTIPFPAFRQMLYEFGDPMSSSFGISVRKAEET